MGCRRPGSKTETLEVIFKRATQHKSDPWDCKMKDQSEWTSWSAGDGATLLIGGLSGAPYCTHLKRKSLTGKPRPDPSPRPKKKKKKRKR